MFLTYHFLIKKCYTNFTFTIDDSKCLWTWNAKFRWLFLVNGTVIFIFFVLSCIFQIPHNAYV
jgi:hypothetical protein